jgi:hypothetical protein
VADDELPAVAAVEPDPGSVAAGATLAMTVTLDIPAPVGGSEVSLASDPGTFGSVPASVTVPADQLSATFNFIAGDVGGQEVVTATLGASSADATVTVDAGASGLVINEIDYDQPSTDFDEFIEIYNGTGAEVDLSNLLIVLVNGGTDNEYKRIDLAQAGTLGAGEYLVIGSQPVLDAVPDGTVTILFDLESNNIQNGNPDAVGLLDLSTGTLVDALSYGGEVTAGNVGSLGTFNFVEGTPASDRDSGSNDGSLSRTPNGSDTNDADTDWAFVATPTPGEANAAL